MTGEEENLEQLPNSVEISEVETLLRKISGVSDCRVVCNEWGAIEEVHILGSSQRHPKQIVRDVESGLAAKWDISIDHKKISVAQVEGKEQNKPGFTRMSLVSINVTSHLLQSKMEAVVVLRCADKEVEGAFSGSVPSVNVGRTPAEAAVVAARKYLDEGDSLTLEDLKRVSMSAGDASVCQLGFSNGRGELDTWLGVASVNNDDEVYGAVQAVLNALNSHLTKFMHC